ncbi:hypothetical protein JOB18_028049 [Solea senegalensis]|uniref:Uncharacterized protein n=1 Tax=Solea senegalensis TaxID=28829 RepID=A0AAV6QQ30_SOLSE|nr:hypothetical protein JOB18_028049 [Solea senegalensis]
MEHSKGLTHEQVALRDQHKAAEIDKLKGSIVTLKQDVETWNMKASKIKKSYLELKEKAETDLMHLREENSDLKEAIKNNDDTMKELKQDFLKMEKVLQKEKAGSAKFLDKNLALQTKIEEQARMLEILHTDNSKLSKLYHDLAEKNMVFQNNKKEIAYLKRAVRELLEHVRIKTETITALRANIKELQGGAHAENLN